MTFVPGILSTASQLSQLMRGGKPAEGAAAAAAASAAASPVNAAAGDAMRQIAAQYDVANISPRAYSEMLQKLRQAGTISDKDYQDLSSIRADLEHDGVDPDKSVNLVELYTKKLAATAGASGAGQATTQQAAMASTQRQLGWLQTLARLHAGQGSPGIDALA